MAESITGVAELDRKLKSLRQRVQTKVKKAAVRAGLSVGSKEIRKAIPPRFKDVRKSIGWKLGKDRQYTLAAKVGWRVGKAARKYKSSAVDRTGRKGVGIGARNFHWWLLGTKARTTDSGKYVGAMPPQDSDIIRNAWSSAQGRITAKIAERLKAGIEREAAKK